MNGVANWVGVGGVPVRVGEGVGGIVRVQVDIGVGVDMLVGKTGVCVGIGRTSIVADALPTSDDKAGDGRVPVSGDGLPCICGRSLSILQAERMLRITRKVRRLRIIRNYGVTTTRTS